VRGFQGGVEPHALQDAARIFMVGGVPRSGAATTASQDFWMGGSEPMIAIEEKILLRWTGMKVYFPPARAKKLIPA
jgi:hypothetical protein